MSELTEHAKQKLQDELKSFSGWSKEKAISKPVCETLKDFCNEEIFAQAVWDSSKTLSDCCKKIMKGVGRSVSDLDVYKAAAKFYLPEADVQAKPELILPGTADSTSTMPKVIDLFSLM
ncbi:MAG: hypothetical protein E7572_03960 [Ruminococcaceae bacterium]|nr:hypothetical protein [Oscillospiraceae bacterium]